MKQQEESRASVFWPAVALALCLVIVKASYVANSPFWDWATPKDYFTLQYIEWSATAATADLCFGIGTGLLAALLLLPWRNWPKTSRFLVRGYIVFGCICVCYAIISRQFFAYSAAPLTYQLLSLRGDISRMSSSLTWYGTPTVLAALVISPLVYLGMIRLGNGLTRRASARGRALGKTAGVLCLLAFVLVARPLWDSTWFTAQDRYIKENPHWALSESFGLQLIGRRTDLRSVTVRKEDLCELISPSPVVKIGGVRAPQQPTPPRNVILIVLESVGTQYLSLYSGDRPTTPRLEAEKKHALIFDSYYAPVGWTAFSLFALVHSLRPSVRSYNTSTFELSPTVGPTLANVLSAKGYHTAFMSAGDPDWASKDFFTGKGFQEILHGTDLTKTAQLSSWGFADHFLYDAMIDWIAKHKSEPFFVMGWTDQTHHPYVLAPDQKPFEGVADPPLAKYLTLVREDDAQIGRLLDTLTARGLAENTLVVVTGDHGEAFGVLHGSKGHGFTVYDEEVKVPLMFWNPRLYPEGEVSHALGSHVDLSATILGTLDIPAPAGWDGRDLLAKAPARPTYLFAAGFGESLLGVRDEQWKYVYDARRGADELYNLAIDPKEQQNVASQNQAQVTRLRERLAAWMQAEHTSRESIAKSCK